VSPLPVLQAAGRGTDQMHFVRAHREIEAAHNQPSLQGQAVDLLEYREDLLRGFRQIYRLCLAEAKTLLAGPIWAFAGDPIRVILRATRTYAHVLAESTHPDLLRDALARDRFFDHLWVQAVEQPQLKPLIAYERDALHAGDIPLFHSRPDTRDLWTADGRCLPDFLVAPSLETVKARLGSLSEADLARQSWIIEAALVTRSMGEPSGSGISLLAPTKVQATPARLIRAACAVGDRLGTLALPGAPGITWLGVNYVDEREWRLARAGLDLYNGGSGIAFFLAYLGALTGSEHYTDLARAALVHLRAQVHERSPFVQAPGGYSGWGSLLYLSAHLGVLWQEDALLEEAATYAALVPDLLVKDQALDLIGGVAGTILCLLALYQAQPRQEVLEVAVRCGDWLLAQAAQCQPAHLLTQGAGTGPRPLTGLSHGAAGMALSLAKLAAVSKAPRFRAGALTALAYERSVFSQARQNWPDFRKQPPGREQFPQAEARADPSQERFTVAWCHGAPGIGLSRLAMLPSLDDEPTLRQEIASALGATLREGFGRNHSLCHGDLGNLETVLVASRVLDEPDSVEALTRLTAQILSSIEAQGWVTGVPLGVETPGLMTGLAGIGYELLRLAEPERVPSVLLLAPPLARHGP
jgi:type 2 lantibiotic biosynthesis protein LanM